MPISPRSCTPSCRRAFVGYEDRKQRTGTLDFLDLLIRARDLVRDCRAGALAPFSSAFRFILVDEFQDTDPLQAELLLLLAAR